jgi:phage terminase large subunit GpA-like protein
MTSCWEQLESTWHSAWKPPQRYKPSEWADRHFVLPQRDNAEGGRFKMARTPYLAGIVDAMVEPGVEDIVFLKPTRVGGTTAGQIMTGYWIDNDPGPLLVVMPTEQAVEKEVKRRIRPLLEASPSLRAHMSPNPHDNTLSVINLDTMTIQFGWAGSPASLGAETCRYVRFDEVDKYPPFAGREADPISLGKERTGTYGHRKRHYITSTPTTAEGSVMKQWKGCGDKRHYYVPCPHCGVFQILAWPRVKWPKLEVADKRELADKIEAGRLAWYVCSNPDCEGRVEESHKPKMLERGVWVSHDGEDKPVQTVAQDGTLVGDRPVSKRIGFHLSSLYSPWRTFAEMAAQFIRADGDVAETMNFRNSRLAEPFEVQVSTREPNHIRQKTKGAGPERIVPSWAVLFIATCDVQKDHVYYSVTAWGYEMQSKRVAIGVAATMDEMYRAVFQPSFPFVMDTGVPIGVQKLVIDSGYRKDEVTEFCRRDPARCEMAKGLSTYFGPIADPKVEKASGVMVWNINTMQSKDTLDRLIKDPDAEKWQVFEGISDEYCAHLASEHKTIDPQTKQMVWKEKSSGAANHWLDCEAMACAVARAQGADAPKPVQDAPRAGRGSQQEIPADDFMSRGRQRW